MDPTIMMVFGFITVLIGALIYLTLTGDDL
jgi:hypothetical protein